MTRSVLRLERIEAALSPPRPRKAVCSFCRREGLTETPYEHCEAKRCEAGKRVVLTPDQHETMREAFEESCRSRGEDPDEVMRRVLEEDRQKRAAWAAKRAAARELSA